MKRIICAFLAAVLSVVAFSFAGCKKNDAPEKTDPIKFEKLGDYIFDAGTFTELDYDYANRVLSKAYGNLGACTAVAKVTSDGQTLVGRNFDFYISNKPAYIVRTKVKGCYETIGLTYTAHETAPDFEDVLKNGVSEDFYKTIPFLSADVMNSEGLYVEINMRSGEVNENGTDKFGCKGTNPASSERVFSMLLPRYICEHCKSVSEANEYVKTLDLYTGEGAASWNFCFLLADPTGDYGVLEIADNRVIWHEKQNAQTNFYIDEGLRAIEEYACGFGRYQLVTDGVQSVDTPEEMYELIKKASYFQMYDPENCLYDPISEYVGIYPEWTLSYLTAPENREIVDKGIQEICAYVASCDRQALRDMNELWESSFTEVANCTEKTIFVRFFEDDDVTMTIGFDK